MVARWQERLADATPEVDAVALTAISRHWLLHRIDALRDWMLPEVAAAVERLDRAHRKGRLSDPPSASGRPQPFGHGAWLLAESDQADAAKAVFALADKAARAAPTDPGSESAPTAWWPSACAWPLAVTPRPTTTCRPSWWRIEHRCVEPGRAATGAASATTWPPRPRWSARPGRCWWPSSPRASRSCRSSRRPGTAAAWSSTMRPRRSVGSRSPSAGTAPGPAILWDFEPHQGVEAVRITVPGLDPTWSTTEVRGDALLGEVAPPAGLETITYVPDHPDIDPDMRRPGAEPEPPTTPMPESGTFS